MRRIFTRAALAGVLAALLADGEALCQGGGEEFSDQIVRVMGPRASSVKVLKDNWQGVVAKHQVADITVPVDQVKDVVYGNAPSKFTRAKRNAKMGAFTPAIGEFGELQASYAEFPWMKQYALDWLGYCHLYRGKQGDLAKSRASFEKLLNEVPDTRFIFQAMLYKADTYYYEENWTGARSAYEAARRKFETLSREAKVRSVQKYCMKRSREAEYWAVRVIEATRDYERAKSSYSQLEVRTDDAEVKIKAQAGVGRCLLRLRMYDQAQKLYEKMIKEADKAGDSSVLGQAYCGLGDCHYEKKDYSRSRWNYLKVVVRDFTAERNYVAKAHLFAGRCYERLGSERKEKGALQRAKRHYKVVLDEYSDSIWKPDAEQALRRLGG